MKFPNNATVELIPSQMRTLHAYVVVAAVAVVDDAADLNLFPSEIDPSSSFGTKASRVLKTIQTINHRSTPMCKMIMMFYCH